MVVDDGSTEDVGILVQTGERLVRFFGARFVYIRNEVALGYGGANTKVRELWSEFDGLATSC